MLTKAITDFSSYPGAELSPIATTIHSSLVKGATTFPDLPRDAAELETLIATFDAALSAKNSRARADYIAFEAARLALEGALGDNGGYVNTVAQGDALIVGASGYPSYQTGASPDYSPPGAPQNVVVRQGMLSGSLVARFRPERRRSVTEAETCVGDPNVEANWKPAGLFTGGKATLSGFEPGTVVWVRFRTVGLNNVMGAASDPAKIMVV